MGTGSCLPDKILTNDDLAKIVDTSDEWIRTRTGIGERRIAAEGQTTSDLAACAAERALEAAGVKADELDLIIVATVTPDMAFPSTACLVQAKIGAKRAAAFDLEAACSGFVYGLATATQFISTGFYQTVLVIGAETLSRIVDWQDRNTCVLFGDGAGAAVLKVTDGPGGFKAFNLGADGLGGNLLELPAGGSRFPASADTVGQRLHYIRMENKAVYRFAVQIMGEAAAKAVEMAGWQFDQIDWLVPHQANMRIIESAMKRWGLSEDKVIINLDRYGNMSSASVPVALDEAVRGGKIRSGNHVVMVGFGGGLTWAS
jgi:3-oxoacyl-[acyl-carrier-protein] synthase-3